MHIERRTAQTPVEGDALHDRHDDLAVVIRRIVGLEQSLLGGLLQAAVGIAPDVGRLALMPAARVDRGGRRIIEEAAKVEPDVEHVVAPIIIEQQDALVEGFAGHGLAEVVLLAKLRKLLVVIIDQQLVFCFEVVEKCPVRNTRDRADVADGEIGVALFL